MYRWHSRIAKQIILKVVIQYTLKISFFERNADYNENSLTESCFLMTDFTQESNTSNIIWGFNSSKYIELCCWDFSTVMGTKLNAQVLGQPVPFNYLRLLPAGSPHGPRWLDSLPALWLPCPLFRIQKVSWDLFSTAGLQCLIVF